MNLPENLLTPPQTDRQSPVAPRILRTVQRPANLDTRENDPMGSAFFWPLDTWGAARVIVCFN